MAEIKNNETGMILKLAGLSVGYKNKTIISNIDLNVKKGEIISLAGSNGCGKSTLLRTLVGQQKALSGSILLDGQNMALYNDISLAKKVSILLTDRVTPLLMTAYDVVCSGRYPYTGMLGILSSEDKDKVREFMELTGITGLADQYFSELSDGQKQRIMLARALCQEPDILIMDEPMTFLDIKYKRELVNIIKRLRNEKGLTMIISLHELEVIREISDMVVCIKDGSIDKTGIPSEILNDDYINLLFDIK
ncbi:MAG: ABC transporter ATP-binding protein [Eubacterium sp.]|nr:ABC transporter ATP-binding protein [Eubacterium sp.]